MKIIKSYKKYLCISVFLILILFSLSCGMLTDKTAREAFLKENPNHKITNSYTGEGWEGVGYHHFEYKKPNDETVYKEMWCFVQQEDGNWKVTGKSTE